MGFRNAVRSWRLRRSLSRHAPTLHRCLAVDYGAGDTYTEAQVHTAMMKTGFPATLMPAGYAAFLSQDDFSKLPGMPAAYGTVRAIFPTSSISRNVEAWNPAPETTQGAFPDHTH